MIPPNGDRHSSPDVRHARDTRSLPPGIRWETRYSSLLPHRRPDRKRKLPKSSTAGQTRAGSGSWTAPSRDGIRPAGGNGRRGQATPALPVPDQKLSRGVGQRPSPRKRTPSLDPVNQLETSVLKFPKRAGQNPKKRPGLWINCKEWLRLQLTEKDREKQQRFLQCQVLNAIHRVMRKWAQKAQNPASPEAAEWDDWRKRFQAVQRRLEGEDSREAYWRSKEWLRANPPRGAGAEWLKWERTFHAIKNCGSEWIAWRAACCEDRTAPIAVPIGCGHRLCPLCAWRRAQRGRVRLKTMTDVYRNPVLVTFTVPNLPHLTAKKISRFRQPLKSWFKQRTIAEVVCDTCGHDRKAHLVGDAGKRACRLSTCQEDGCACRAWSPRALVDRGDWGIFGGVYSIETTYARWQKSWHVHGHALVDFNHALPPKYVQVEGRRRENKVDFFGERVWAFTRLKWTMEFEWLQLTSGGKWGSKPSADPPSKSWKVRAKWKAAREAWWKRFEEWVHEARAHSTYHLTERSGRYRVPKRDLTEKQLAEYHRCTRWNQIHRRTLDLRPVKDRDGAAAEVLKYITKVAGFSDNEVAIETFCNATRGLRLVQSFGTFYGFDLAASFETEHLDDWGKRECACGVNHWIKDGVVRMRDVYMETDGRWRLKPEVVNCRGGTVARPRIRAENAREEVA